MRLPEARCLGEYSHCGGIPRTHRRDAAIATAELIMALDRLWDESQAAGKDFAFTVGKLGTDLARHALTIIAGEVRFGLDMRSLSPDYLAEVERRLDAIADEVARRRGVRFELGRRTRAAPGILDEGIKARLRADAAAGGVRAVDIPSGASHDAAAFAAAGVPTAMLFVRNQNGSHNPHEAMRLEDCLEGTTLLAAWLAGR
jgi:N-carbamoyl-L-amino-acid hydrolase